MGPWARYVGWTLNMVTSFTPVSALIGGSLIGLASVLLMLLHGRIAGMTGILSGALFTAGPDRGWRIAFLLGAIAAPMAIFLVTGQAVEFANPVPNWAIIVGGVIVGVGVTYGSGCTSGHGVCGVARLSPRSIVATIVFMAATAATVFVFRHIL
jgi:uncharacterized membrane protein YedE/YeeE